MPTPASSLWPVTVWQPSRKRVLQAEGQPVDAELAGQLVVERLLHDRRLRHAEAAEGAGDRPVGVDRAAVGAIVRRQIGAGGMDRHAVGHGRPPARIGAGVEIAGEDHAGDAALGVGADGRLHRRPDGAWWSTSSIPCACRRAPPAGRSSARPGRSAAAREMSSLEPKPPPVAVGTMRTFSGGKAEHDRRVVAVHIGRLRAGADHQRVAVHLGPAGLRLDIGVLDIGRLDRSGNGMSGVRQAPARDRRARRSR